MEYISVNNKEFKIAKTSTNNIVTSIDTVENNTESTRTLLSLKTTEEELNEEAQQYRGINMMWASTVMLSFVVWIVCIVSLVLNVLRKNVGKAVFSGVGILIPLLVIFMSTVGRILSVSGMALGSVICYIALLVEIITLILSFIFCFSKDKKVENQQNKAQ